MRPSTWLKLHAYISIFFLPLAFIYAITGGLIILKERGESHKTTHQISIPADSKPSTAIFKPLVENFLKENNIPTPSGDPRMAGERFFWGRSTSLLISIFPGRNGKATLNVITPNLIFSLVMFHRGKCGMIFNWMGLAFGISMIIMYISGIAILWKNKAHRKKMAVCLVTGTFLTLIAMWISA